MSQAQAIRSTATFSHVTHCTDRLLLVVRAVPHAPRARAPSENSRVPESAEIAARARPDPGPWCRARRAARDSSYRRPRGTARPDVLLALGGLTVLPTTWPHLLPRRSPPPTIGSVRVSAV